MCVMLKSVTLMHSAIETCKLGFASISKTSHGLVMVSLPVSQEQRSPEAADMGGPPRSLGH